MGKNTYLVLVAYLIVESTDLSQGYGTKGGTHSFSQSYSSSSASAHSSSYSSSGSYTYGTDKGTLPIIGPIPISSSAAVASASAGAASAVSGTSAVAGASSNSATDQKKGSYDKGAPPFIQPIPISGIDYAGSAPGGGASVSEASSNIVGDHKRGSVAGASSNNGVSGSYGSSSGGTYGSQTAGIVPGSPGKETENNAVLRVPCCKPIAPGPKGSIYDYKVPSKVDSIGTTTSGVSGYGHTNVASGSYGTSTTGSQVSSSGYGQTIGSGNYGGVTQQKPSIGGSPAQKKPCCKGPFPGPNGSIYDSKPASAVGTAVKPSSVQEPIKPQLPLHRPPVNFPGPSGSIYTSKPVNAGPVSNSPGTYNKPGGYQQSHNGDYQSPGVSTISSNSVVGGYTHTDATSVPKKPQGQYEYQTNTNAVSSTDGSYQTQYESVSKKPIGQHEYQSQINVGQQTQYQPSPKQPGGQYGYQSSTNVASGNVNYQTQYQGSGGYKPSCNQGVCSKEPPRTYLQPPQDQGKPVVETVQEQPIPINIPNPGNAILIPQTQTPATPLKPGVSGIQVSSINSGYNTGKGTPVISNEPEILIGPGKPQYNQNQPQQTGSGVQQGYQGGKVTPVISNKPEIVIGPGQPQSPQYNLNQQTGSGVQQGYQGGYSASSSASGSSSSSTGYSVSGGVHGVVQNPTGSSVTIIDGNQKKEDGDRVLYVSGPGHSPSVTENTIIGSSLQEGPRGSPLVPGSYDKYDGKTTGYDGSKDDSAIVFFDGNQGSGGYSSGRGYASSGSVYSQTGAGGSNMIYSSSEGAGKKPTGTHVNTGHAVSGSGSTQGVVLVGTTDNTSGSYGVTVSGTSGIAPSTGSSSGSFLSGSVGHKGAPCTSYGCPTSNRQYSNRDSTKNVDIHISAAPVGSYSSGGDRTSGSYGGTSSYSLNEGGSSGGSYIASSVSTGNGGVGGGYASGHKGIPCTSGGCGTSYHQNSNGVPTKNVAIHISAVPVGSYSSGGDKTSGSYGGTSSYSLNEGGSSGGSYMASSVSTGNGGVGGGYASGHKGIPCTSGGCGTSYRQYSNGVPSEKVSIHVSSIPISSGGTFSSGGSYSGGSSGGSYGGKGGSVGGGYSASSASAGTGGDGGFLSSIFLGDGGGSHSGSYSKGGSYGHSSSFSKASSYASSSSFSSASSGSYGSSHY